ncbi:flagellar protein FlgN [Vagococcus sp. BWB3-3]|uniref:Flagellar protein FlgN n=1 Tax=Vagococcus allomyrinae TaxID=2794353 RepID=A0A940P9A6_9ENTE|nr:flagellar protein FlgN [Vagococcus allomyrinae]MBP1042016.1 flagellar protein FlgN [Vagococcus allomyrinae]
MEQDRQLQQLLRKFISLLKKEKQALIKNDGPRVSQLVKEKESFVELLGGFEPTGNPEIRDLVLKIRDLQADNLLLTEQALSYHDTFLSAVTQGLKKANSTYSRYGNLSEQEDVSLINQSF